MNPYIAEVLGTFLLILIGNGIVANVVLKNTKADNEGFLFITIGWGLAVFFAVMVVAPFSGAHINPAVTIGLALVGKFSWALVPGYLIAQLAGAFLGGLAVFIFYKDHYKITEDTDAIRATFCTSPAIKNTFSNFFSEMIGTFTLVLAVLFVVSPSLEINGEQQLVGLGSLEALPVGLIVWVIGMGLGGTTGYAINPARDLGPRIAHAFINLKHKGANGWSYSWIPVLGPFAGGALAAGFYLMVTI